MSTNCAHNVNRAWIAVIGISPRSNLGDSNLGVATADGLYALVAADLRTLYTVEYQSSNDKRDGKWREIKVELVRPDLIARARQGYFAK